MTKGKRGRPQPVDPPQGLSEQGIGDGGLHQMECDILAVAHDLRTDLDQLLAQRGQRFTDFSDTRVRFWLKADMGGGRHG